MLREAVPLRELADALANALRLVPAAGEPGHATADALAAGLALILRARLEPAQRLMLAAGALRALDATAAEELARAALADIARWRLGPVAAERQRQIERWRRWCANSPHRSPPLTRAEARIADGIALGQTPRERLAGAWQMAGDDDRGDLMARATMGGAR